MLGRANMREQSFLSATVQNMKRIVRSSYRKLRLFLHVPNIIPCQAVACQGVYQ